MTGRDGQAVDVELLVIAECPHEQPAVELFRRILDDTGQPDEIRIGVIRTEDEAARRGFHGSPTFLINGVDALAESGADPGIACRVYLGGSGLPTRDDLTDAVTRLAGRPGNTSTRAPSETHRQEIA